MARKRTPSAKAIAATQVVVEVKETISSPVKIAKPRLKAPAVPPTIPSPSLPPKPPELRQQQVLVSAPSDYEEVIPATRFKSLSAATINASPCKLLHKSSPCKSNSSLHPSPSRLSSPSILRRKPSFAGRILHLNEDGKLPVLSTVVPPVIKKEMVEEARLASAARALEVPTIDEAPEQYSSEDDEDCETQPRKRARQGPGFSPSRRSHSQQSRGRRRSTMGESLSSRAYLEVPPRLDSEEQLGEVESKPQSKALHNVLLAMAEFANPSECKQDPEPPVVNSEETPSMSALSMLRAVSPGRSRSRPNSTEPEPAKPSTSSGAPSKDSAATDDVTDSPSPDTVSLPEEETAKAIDTDDGLGLLLGLSASVVV